MPRAGAARLLTGLLAASCAAAGFTTVLLLKRLPAAADFVVPRRPGYWLFEAAMDWSGRGAGTVVAGIALILVITAAFLLLFDLTRSVEFVEGSGRLKSAAAMGAGLLVLLFAARFAVSWWFDLLINAWFAPGSADLREPILAFMGVFWTVFFLQRALTALVRRPGPSEGGCSWRAAAAWGSAFFLPALALRLWAASSCDLRASGVAQAAGIPQEPARREAVLVLTAAQGGPDFEVHTVELGWPGVADLSKESLVKLGEYQSRRPRSVFSRSVLRLLYEGHARLLDPLGLRQTLWGAVLSGDALAWMLLVEHLSCAPPEPLAAELLDKLADERRWRIGPRAAAMLAGAYAHLGLKDKSVVWEERAAAGPGAIPRGLMGLPEAGGSLRPGTVRGTARGLARARVGLYARKGAFEPYALNAGRLAAAADADARGRFRFEGLAAGDYFLAFSVPEGALPGRKEAVVVRGHKGDIRLSPRRPSVDLGTLDVRFDRDREARSHD